MTLNTRTFIAIVVTIVWAASYLADILSSDFSPSPLLNPVMILVAGFFFRTGLEKGEANDEPD